MERRKQRQTREPKPVTKKINIQMIPSIARLTAAIDGITGND